MENKYRQTVSVNIPIENDVAYSLFAQGFLISIPQKDEDNNCYVFKFLGDTVFCLFYKFANFRRAYIATAWLNKDDGEAFYLPGINIPLYIIFKAKGRKIDELKHALYILTKTDHYAPFRLKIDFWKELALRIEYKDCYREKIIYTYNKYATKARRIEL